MSAIGGVAAPVWPPTGIALAALLLLGREVWPGVFLGAFSVNFSVGVPMVAAFGIAVGNTLEAWCAAYYLVRITNFQPALKRLSDVLGLAVFGALGTTLISAVIGTSTIWLAGMITTSQFRAALATWWLGDMVGNLVVAPFLLTWGNTISHRTIPRRLSEAFALLILLSGTAYYVFGDGTFAFEQDYPLEFLVFPFVIWAALRLGPRGTSLATLAISVIAIWQALHHRGFFGAGELHEGLFVLQIFIGITALTGMILAATIAEREASQKNLKTANLELEQLSQRKSEFTSMVTHELKTPLTAIKESIEIVLDGIDGPVTSEQRETLGLAQKNIKRLARLITGVLEFSRFESGRLELFLEQTDMNLLVEETVTLMQNVALKKSVTLSANVPKGKITTVCDSDKIKQVLINLLDNAIKHTPTGGQVSVTLLQSTPFVRLVVQDNGSGIAKEEQLKIFNMFHQTRDKNVLMPGFGIGLAVCKMILEEHGGKIELESAPGEGSTFTVSLPLEKVELGGIEPPTSSLRTKRSTN